MELGVLCPVRAPGTYNFDNHLTGLVLSDFMLGALGGAGLDQAAPNTLFTRQEYLGIYAQDTWKMSQHLTLNYGVRWEPWFPVSVTNGANTWFSMPRFVSGTKSTVFPNAPPGMYYGGDPGFPDSSVNKRWGNVAPRVGLAWDPKGDGRMTVRASWGEFFDYPNGQHLINMTIGPPFGDETRTGAAGVHSLDNPWSTFPAGIRSRSHPIRSNALFVPFGPYLSLDPQKKNTAVNSWNLTVQKQIGAPWLVTVSYIGSETAHLWLTNGTEPVGIDLRLPGRRRCRSAMRRPPQPCTTTINQRRLLNQINPTVGGFYGFVDGVNDGGTQSYNALHDFRPTTAGERRELQRQLHLEPLPDHGPLRPWRRDHERQQHLSESEQHRATTRGPAVGTGGTSSICRALPKCRASRTPPCAVVASGWQVAVIVRYQSGTPLNIFDADRQPCERRCPTASQSRSGRYRDGAWYTCSTNYPEQKRIRGARVGFAR